MEDNKLDHLEIYNRLDRNKDGKISKKEFKDAILIQFNIRNLS